MTSDPRPEPTTDGWNGQHPPTQHRAAGVGRRVGAYLVDWVGLIVVLGIAGAATGLGAAAAGGGADATPTGLSDSTVYGAQAVGALISLTYFALLEGGAGQTLAKRLFGLKVVMANGDSPTVEAAVRRRLPFVVGMVIPVIGGLVNFALLLVVLVTTIQGGHQHRGIHDRWAGTMVIDA